MDDVSAKEFLTIKSTEQQKKEGVERLVDTAFVEEHNGELILKAVFDVHHFKPEEVSLKVGYILHFSCMAGWLRIPAEQAPLYIDSSCDFEVFARRGDTWHRWWGGG